MRIHPLCRLGLADGVTVTNIAVGFAAILTVPLSMVAWGSGGYGLEAFGLGVTARLILLGAIADGLDGVLARRGSSTAVGPLLDSIADVVSFGVAPALFVFGVAWTAQTPADSGPQPVFVLVAAVITTVYVVASILRTAVYTVSETVEEFRGGVPNTLAAIVLAVAYLAGVDSPPLLLAATCVLSYLMVIRTPYPGLRARDAFGVGAVQAVVVVAPASAVWLARLLLGVSLAYLLFGPIIYRNRGISK